MPRLVITLLSFLLIGAAQAADIRIATFNTESDDDTQPAKVAETIGKLPNVDIWALQEGEDALKRYLAAAKGTSATSWRSVISESGVNTDRQSDRLGILYRIDIFRRWKPSSSTPSARAATAANTASPTGACARRCCCA